MTFETILTIHSLLAKNKEKAYQCYKGDQNSLESAKDQGASKGVLKEIEERLATSEEAYRKALSALTEFENHEWR